jgi:hypothetical protein
VTPPPMFDLDRLLRLIPALVMRDPMFCYGAIAAIAALLFLTHNSRRTCPALQSVRQRQPARWAETRSTAPRRPPNETRARPCRRP